MITKIFGACLVIVSCSLAGFCLNYKNTIRIRELQNLSLCLDIICNEMCISLKTVPESIQIASKHASSINKAFFDEFLSLYENERLSLSQSWEKALENSKTFKTIYENKETEIFKSFGQLLGTANAEFQGENIKKFKKSIEDMADKSKENSSKLSVAGKLGIYIGIIIVILIF